MQYQYIPYLWITASTLAVVIVLSRYVWQNRNVRGAIPFLITLVFVAIWTLAQGLEFAATDLPTKIMWANIQYLSIMYAPVTYLFLVLQFTGHERLMARRWLPMMLMLTPIIVNVMFWTNDLHGLLRQNIFLDTSGPFPLVGKTFGPLFWFIATYNMAINLLSLTLLANAMRQKALVYHKQVSLLFLGQLLPVLTTILHLSGLLPIQLDPTPMVFGLSSLMIAWGIFRYRLFDVVPVARSSIIERMSTGVVVLDKEGRVVDYNPAAMKVLGHKSAQLAGSPAETVFGTRPNLLRLYHEGMATSSELAVEDNGTTIYYEVSFAQMKDSRERLLGWLMLAHNITERKRAEEVVRHLAYHDFLTGLPNRKFFQELSYHALIQARRRNELLVVAFIDLDGFKQVNDTLGHDSGDRFLCEIVARLKGATRQSDVISRQGGDEFTLLLTGVKNLVDVDIIARKTFEAFEDPVKIDGHILWIRASIGFSIFPKNGDDIETLIKKADAAMYVAKRKGKNTYHIYAEKT